MYYFWFEQLKTNFKLASASNVWNYQYSISIYPWFYLILIMFNTKQYSLW